MANEIDIKTLCDYWENLGLKMTWRTYYNLAKDGKVPKPDRGKVNAIKALTMIAIHFQAGEESSDLTEERRLKTRVERQIKELEEKKLRGELMERVEVDNELIQRTYVIKSDMLAIEKRLVKWPDARDIVKKGHLYMMKRYSQKSGVFRGGK